jgi:hypothetical protein
MVISKHLRDEQLCLVTLQHCYCWGHNTEPSSSCEYISCFNCMSESFPPSHFGSIPCPLLPLYWHSSVSEDGLQGESHQAAMRHFDSSSTSRVQGSMTLAFVGQSLDLRACRNLDAAGLVAIGRLTQLKQLNLNNLGWAPSSESLADAALQQLADMRLALDGMIHSLPGWRT